LEVENVKATNRPIQKTALVLCGGGVRGAVEVGFYRALVELGVRIDLIVGTSIGALNGAFIAGGTSPDELAHLWRAARRSDFFAFNWSVLWRGWHVESLFTQRQFRRYLETHLREKRFEALRWPLVITATDLRSGRVVPLGPARGDLIQAVLASTAMPGIFPPVNVAGRDLIDGGVSANVPLDVAIEHGATTILAMECACGEPQNGRPRGLVEIFYHAFHLAVEAKYRTDVTLHGERARLILLRPDLPCTPGIGSFGDTGRLIDAGYQTAKAALRAEFKLSQETVSRKKATHVTQEQNSNDQTAICERSACG
jgi:NTE family protein